MRLWSAEDCLHEKISMNFPMEDKHPHPVLRPVVVTAVWSALSYLEIKLF